jgi:hypothetical protein
MSAPRPVVVLAEMPEAAGRDVAFYSESALEDLRRISASNIREFLAGRPDQVFRLVEPAV